MSWGNKIVLAFVSFVLFLGVLVYRSVNNKVHLVAPDYYEKELAYQVEIDKLNNEKELEESATIQVDAKAHRLYINFPDEHKVQSGKVTMYRPSDASMDVSYNLTIDQKNQYILFTGDLAKGLWKVQLEWINSSKSYLKEQNVFLP
jgi:hypothetical protein